MAVKRYKGAKAKADTLFSTIIRSLGYCEAKGHSARACSNQLQTAHIVTRKRSATRTDTRNAFCLCFAHHRFYTDYPREFSHFISETWAQLYYDEVYAKSVRPTKVNWDEEAQRLKGLKQRIDNGEITLAEAREEENL